LLTIILESEIEYLAVLPSITKLLALGKFNKLWVYSRPLVIVNVFYLLPAFKKDPIVVVIAHEILNSLLGVTIYEIIDGMW
jgi:hypothetical protein